MAKFALGLDYGTQSGRAVLIDVADGRMVASSVFAYPDGVMDEKLPDGTKLPPFWALQNPEDYRSVLRHTIPETLRMAKEAENVDPADVVAIGVDFTSCTILPVDKTGEPLCLSEAFSSNPHAWVKLWKHHGAAWETEEINRIAAERGEDFFPYFGGKLSSESFLPKVWQIYREAPEVYSAAWSIVEACDWITWQLAGADPEKLCRCACSAGYKAIWSPDRGYPSPDFLAALDPGLRTLAEDKLHGEVVPIGHCIGHLTEEWAKELGLPAGIPIAAGNVDAHVAVPSAGITGPGKMLMVLGTSAVQLVLADHKTAIPGLCAVVENGAMDGYVCYEGGQSAVGDIFEWFTTECVPASVVEEAKAQGKNIHALLEERAAKLAPGESGLVALDWFNGNRCILSDMELSGMILGMTLQTKPEEIYRALIEAAAFGARRIIDAMEEGGVPVEEIRVCGGLPDKNKLLMQIYADITGRELRVCASTQTPALGSAMWGTIAAGAAGGGYDTIEEAAAHMAHLREGVWKPIPEHRAVYEELYAEYKLLHHIFGEGQNDVMKRLRALRRRQKA